jgi:hypothetical protein
VCVWGGGGKAALVTVEVVETAAAATATATATAAAAATAATTEMNICGGGACVCGWVGTGAPLAHKQPKLGRLWHVAAIQGDMGCKMQGLCHSIGPGRNKAVQPKATG